MQSHKTHPLIVNAFSGLVLISIALILHSCQKELSSGDASSNNPGYYLKFKKNGSWITWTKVLSDLGPDLADNTKTDLGVSGTNDTQTELLDLSFQVNGPRISPGTYSSDDYFMPVLFIRNANSPSMESFGLGSVAGKPDSKYEVTITSITDKLVKGQFKGNYLENDFNAGEIIEITEGEFVAPRIR